MSVGYGYVFDVGMCNFSKFFFHVFGGSLDGHILISMFGNVLGRGTSRKMKY